ncbi:sodium-dependent transporter [Palaeococcus ferrophilus]|uniref:sodium-dependent transporter n=1 Tax=Palaeococcus ferrophilus TaxID=83868 RepID=UPI001476C569|nr:sodium-dependent transporter [Palaeococcus ferrophilus]
MAEQAVYSLGVGLGFFLVMGSYLPDDVPTPLLALGGALVDTLASFLGTFLTGAVIGLNSPAAMDGDSILFTVLPETLGEIPHGTVLRYLFAFALFLAAITSMIPLGETVARIYSEVSWVKRSDAVVKTMLGAFFVGVFAVLGMERGFDTVGLLDSTVATFALIGGVVSAWAALTGKNYIPPYLRAWALLGALSLAVLGVFAVYNLFISGRYLPLLLLAMGVLLAMSLTSRVKERVEMGLRIPSRYR